MTTQKKKGIYGWNPNLVACTDLDNYKETQKKKEEKKKKKKMWIPRQSSLY
jgi:hypothetical protein